MATAYRIATVLGIPIRLHISLALIVLILARRFGIGWGLFVGAGLIASIVLHELGHSWVAQRKGCRVRSITLMCIGGAAQMERIPVRPLDEFLMAAAGPAVSLVLSVALLTAGAFLSWLPLLRGIPLNALQMIGAMNLGLLIFNLLPAFPMDGGRILRSALAPRLGRLRATFVASRLGRIMAVVFAIYGLHAKDWSGWTLVVIAFFVFAAAGQEYRLVERQEAARTEDDDAGWSEAIPAFDVGEADEVVVGPPPFEQGRGVRRPMRTAAPPRPDGWSSWNDG